MPPSSRRSRLPGSREAKSYGGGTSINDDTQRPIGTTKAIHDPGFSLCASAHSYDRGFSLCASARDDGPTKVATCYNTRCPARSLQPRVLQHTTHTISTSVIQHNPHASQRTIRSAPAFQTPLWDAAAPANHPRNEMHAAQINARRSQKQPTQLPGSTRSQQIVRRRLPGGTASLHHWCPWP